MRPFPFLLVRSPTRFAVTLAMSLCVLIALSTAALAQPANPRATPSANAPFPASDHKPASPKTLHAKASWYGPGFQGRETSTGQTFNPHKLTAASSKLPLGSTAEVKNLQNGRKVKVKINDCGPNVAGRKVDLSSRAANQLKMKHAGVVPVEVKVLHEPADAHPCTQ